MKTYDEFMNQYINEGKSFRKISSGAAASKIHGLKNKIHSTSAIDEKINLLANMISIQSSLFFARDLLGGK